jgi:O-acetyl-ADP-ribose deacetylase (regulator of RNase III)
MLELDQYRSLVALDRPFVASRSPLARSELVRVLIEPLIADGTAARLALEARRVIDAGDPQEPRRLLRRLLTIRSPEPLPDEWHRAMDSLLQEERGERSVVDVRSIPRAARSIAVWQGDITTVAADAIVNAANAELLGCFRPFHACIDNAIHTAAGPRLREDCGRIRTAQGYPEPTGSAKVTRGYNLPARYVLHTVGPVVEGTLRPEHEAALSACYRACLDLAAAVAGIRSVAFCGISTGVFGFPKAPAARIAVHTVEAWLRDHPGALDVALFNVFGDEDREIYTALLQERAARETDDLDA